MAEQLDRIAPIDAVLRSAAAVDADAAELRADLQLRQRREAMCTSVSWIAANGPLRSGLTEQDAVAVVWTMASPEVHALYRDGCGWSRKRYENWLCDALLHTLLPPAGPPEESTESSRGERHPGRRCADVESRCAEPRPNRVAAFDRLDG